MNERLIEIYRSCRPKEALASQDQFKSANVLLGSEVEKFAELIIRECGQVLVNNTPVVDLVEDWDKGYDRAMNDCIHHIYEHFGVE